MPKSKIMQLLVKYADEKGNTTIPGNSPLAQTSKEEQKKEFFHDLHMKLRIVLNDIEHDVGLLKIRNFDPEMQKLLSDLWNRMEEFYRKINLDNSIKIANEIVEFLDNYHTKAVIDNLDFLAENHIKKTNIDFIPNKFMVHPETRSLKLLKKLKQFVKEKLQELIPPSSMKGTVRAPSRPNMSAVKIPQLTPTNISNPTSQEDEKQI